MQYRIQRQLRLVLIMGEHNMDYVWARPPTTAGIDSFVNVQYQKNGLELHHYVTLKPTVYQWDQIQHP